MASGDTLFVLTAADFNEPPSSNFATFDTRNGRNCLDFDADTDEEAIRTLIMPQNYANTTGITAVLWMGSTTDQTSGTVAWEILLERVIEDSSDLDADSFATSAAGNRFTQTAPAGASQIASDSKTIAKGAVMDSVVAGDMFRIKIRRDADGTSQTDSMTGDAELYGIEIRET
jgi:hypothetical protein